MSMMSLTFLIAFLPAVFLLYWAFRKQVPVQNCILMIGSLVFYGWADWRTLMILIACIVITYAGGLLYESSGSQTVLKVSLVLNFLILIYFKYTNFILATIGMAPLEIILPAGVSFYVFQSSTYLFALLQGSGTVEHNPVNYALFVSFFPVIMSGPIQRSNTFLPRLKNQKHLSYEQFEKAILLFLWGVFLKLVIADRLALFTDPVFDAFEEYSGLMTLTGMVLYSFQIYADFSGYSLMAMAVAQLFGYPLDENFRQPYLALTIADFWRRWHISLTSWFRDYVYIPLGGSRQGRWRQYRNIMIVFLISGLWHGAAKRFIIWGALHALFQIIGHISLPLRKTVTDFLHINRKHIIWKSIQRLNVFVLTTFAWVFFRAYSVSAAIGIFRCLVHFSTVFDLASTGMKSWDKNIILIALPLLACVSVLKENGFDSSMILKRTWSRWIVYLILMISIVLYGMYGPGYSASNFIYEGF